MQDESNMRFWLDQLATKIIEAHPKGDIIISSGISPSGPYHVGHAREILTADAIRRVIEENGRKARHLHFVDNFDTLRKRYPYLDESYEEQVGKPLYMVPAPDGKSANYGDQFFKDYQESAKKLGVEMEIYKASELYNSGKYSEMINLCLSKRDQIVDILFKISGRELDSSWQPIQILDEISGKLNTAKFLDYDFEDNTADYIASDGNRYKAYADKGQIKLDWRLDWPARWYLYGVMVEGFGREHATKGGSYDTGVVIAKEIFGTEAPMPVPYDIISLKGETKKMSSSLGNLVTLLGSLEIIPPEILRYFTFKSRPERQLNFDPGTGLYVLMDEYAKTEAATLRGEDPEFKRAWQIANLAGDEHVISTVPFSHMVTVYQTANGKQSTILDLLERTGHADAVKNQKESILNELAYIDRWLELYAPEKVKFAVLKVLPVIEISDIAETFLTELVIDLEKSDMQPESIHNSVYESAVKTDLKPAEAFKLIYQLFIGKDYGPKIGFFLSCLPKEFVLQRLSRKK